jgi:hypothetical protein
MLGVRDRIDRKIMEQIRPVHPKDLFYQILDGLRSLTALRSFFGIVDPRNGDDGLQLVAEQIAWTKAKSQRIGLQLTLDDDVRMMLESGQIHGFDRRGETWHEWTGRPVARLAELLDYNGRSSSGADLRERSILCAPLVTRAACSAFEGRCPKSWKVDAVRRGTGRTLSIPGRGRHRHPESHGVAGSEGLDRRAESTRWRNWLEAWRTM